MTAWLIGAITLVLILFIVGRGCSRAFREQAEYPKFKFLENLGTHPADDHTHDQPTQPTGEEQ